MTRKLPIRVARPVCEVDDVAPVRERESLTPPSDDASERQSEIKLWDHVRYGQVNVLMLKALLATGKKPRKPC